MKGTCEQIPFHFFLKFMMLPAVVGVFVVYLPLLVLAIVNISKKGMIVVQLLSDLLGKFPGGGHDDGLRIFVNRD